MNELVLKIRNIDVAYDNQLVLTDINLDIRTHDFIALIGPNGGGKTTLLKVIMRIIKPLQGTIEHFQNGKPIKIPSIGYLPQTNHFDSRFPISVEEVVLSGLMSEVNIFRAYKPKHYKQLDETLQRTKIESLRKKSIGKLSGGQMRRVFLARAIISKPTLLVLDEPNTFIDTRFENELYNILQELNKKMAVLIVSHDVGTVVSHVKSIACVNRKLHYHPANEVTQELLNAYDCPIDLITHGKLPHRVLNTHK